jgi:hypothetical protein
MKTDKELYSLILTTFRKNFPKDGFCDCGSCVQMYCKEMVKLFQSLLKEKL